MPGVATMGETVSPTREKAEPRDTHWKRSSTMA
jgi:hypothetical protein